MWGNKLLLKWCHNLSTIRQNRLSCMRWKSSKIKITTNFFCLCHPPFRTTICNAWNDVYYIIIPEINGKKWKQICETQNCNWKIAKEKNIIHQITCMHIHVFLPFLDQPGDNFKVNFYNCTTKWLLYFLKQLIFVIYITCLQVYRYFILIVQRYKESVFENKITYLESIKLGARKNIQMQKGKEECSE